MHTMRFAPLVLLSAALACSDRSGTGGGGETGGTVVIVSPGTGTSPLLPPLTVDGVGHVISDNVYERLAEIGPDLNARGDSGFTPRLAQRWEWAPDSLSIAFMLDPRAKWHDGRPVRASDVAFTMRLLKDPKAENQYTSLLTNVDSISVRDSLTAVAWFKKRTPEQFYDVAHQTYVLPEHILKDIPPDKLATSDAAAHPIGSGRFRFERFEPGVRMVMVADTTHYRGRPKLDRVILSFVSDPNAAITQVLSGEADFFETVPPDVVPRLDSSQTARPYPYTGLQYSFLGMNQRAKRSNAPHPIFSDRRVRQAIAMGVDRQAMLQNVFGTRGTLGSGPFSRKLADTTVVLPPFDRARAAALLDSAGWRAGPDGMRSKNGRPLAFGILTPTSSRPRMAYSVLLQEQFKAIGVRAEPEQVEVSVFVNRLTSGDFDAVQLGLNTDPSRSSVQQNWGTGGMPPAGQNFLKYSNRTFDTLVDSAVSTFDRSRADQYYHRAIQTLVDDAPAVFLYDIFLVAAVNKRVRIEGVRPNGWHLGLADWWIPANERIARDRIGLRPSAQN